MKRREEEGLVDKDLLPKKHVTARIPLYVVKYCNDHDISYSRVLMKGFDAYRENDVRHAIERLRYHEDRVLHWRQIVLHHDTECGTKQQICNTVRDLFIEQGRGNPEQRRLDKNWLVPRVRDIVKQGIPISVEELYEFCCTRGKDYE